MKRRGRLAHVFIEALPPRHGYDSIFPIRLNSVSESFDSDSTHDTQWLSNIDSNQLTTQNSFLEFDSNRLMTAYDSKSFPEF